MRYLVALLILIGMSAPSLACINDSELPNHEREFRSNYGDPAPTPEASEPDSDYTGRDWVLMGSGVTLLVGSVGLVLRLRRRES